MNPYYQDDFVTIYHGDCQDILPTLSDVGLVLTSPPYNLSEGGRRVRGSEWSGLDGGYASYDDDMPHDDYVEWQRKVLGLCWDALAADGAIYYQHKPIMRDGACRLPFEQIPDRAILRQVLTWDRLSGFTRCHWYYVPRFEWIVVLAKPEFRITSLDVFDLWQIPCEAGTEHPAPFPLKLARQAVATTTARLVVDPFMGSGTTLRAAKDCGRRAIGIEISERYCEIAAKRMAQEVLAL